MKQIKSILFLISFFSQLVSFELRAQEYVIAFGRGSSTKEITIKEDKKALFEKLVEKSPYLKEKIISQKSASLIKIPQISYVQFTQLMRLADALSDESQLNTQLNGYDSPYVLTWLLQAADTLQLTDLKNNVEEKLGEMLSGQKKKLNWLTSKPSEQMMRITDFCGWFEQIQNISSKDSLMQSLSNQFFDRSIEKIGVVRKQLPEKKITAAHCFSSDKQDVLVVAGQKTLRTYALPNLEPLQSQLINNTVFSLSSGNNNTWVVAGQEKEVAGYSLPKLDSIFTISQAGSVRVVAAHPTQPLCVVSTDKDLSVYNYLLTKRSLIDKSFTKVAFSKDGVFLVAIDGSNQALVFNSQKNWQNFIVYSSGLLTAIELSDTNTNLYMGTQSGDILKTSLPNTSQFQNFSIDQDTIKAIAVDHKQKNMAVALDTSSKIVIRDAVTGQKKIVQLAVKGLIRALDFSYDDQQLYVLDSFGQMTFIDISLFDGIEQLTFCQKMILAHIAEFIDGQKQQKKQLKKQLLYYAQASRDIPDLLEKLPSSWSKKISEYVEFKPRDKRFSFTHTDEIPHVTRSTKSFWARVYQWFTKR